MIMISFAVTYIFSLADSTFGNTIPPQATAEVSTLPPTLGGTGRDAITNMWRSKRVPLPILVTLAWAAPLKILIDHVGMILTSHDLHVVRGISNDREPP